jgi:hypothetical protein
MAPTRPASLFPASRTGRLGLASSVPRFLRAACLVARRPLLTIRALLHLAERFHARISRRRTTPVRPLAHLFLQHLRAVLAGRRRRRVVQTWARLEASVKRK